MKSRYLEHLKSMKLGDSIAIKHYGKQTEKGLTLRFH